MTARILVVDDVPAIRRSMGLVLEQEGDWTICGEAEKGKVAIDRVRELRPNVVILDLSMPVMNGLEAARVIKTIAPGTRILNVYPAHLPAFAGRGPEGRYLITCFRRRNQPAANYSRRSAPWSTSSRLFPLYLATQLLRS